MKIKLIKQKRPDKIEVKFGNYIFELTQDSFIFACKTGKSHFLGEYLKISSSDLKDFIKALQLIEKEL